MNLNEIEEKGRRFALQVTAAFILFLAVLCLAIRINPKPKYQELAIRLDPVPVTREKSASSPKNEPVKAQEKTRSNQEKRTESKAKPEKQENKAEKKVEKPVKKPDPAKNKPHSDSSTQKVEEPKIRKSMEELMTENNSARKKKVEFDESLFADDNSPVQTKETVNTRKVAVPKSSLSGSSASSGSTSASAAASSSSSGSSSDSTVSASTANALSDIKDTVFSSTVADGIKSKTSIQASRSNGVVSMQMADGSSRQLLHPRSPSITISEENARLIDATKNVKISFTVRADGTVPVVEIQITPSSSIPAQIQSEIKAQIKDWKFSEEPSGKNARAMFNYSLELRR